MSRLSVFLCQHRRTTTAKFAKKWTAAVRRDRATSTAYIGTTTTVSKPGSRTGTPTVPCAKQKPTKSTVSPQTQNKDPLMSSTHYFLKLLETQQGVWGLGFGVWGLGFG